MSEVCKQFGRTDHDSNKPAPKVKTPFKVFKDQILRIISNETIIKIFQALCMVEKIKYMSKCKAMK